MKNFSEIGAFIFVLVIVSLTISIIIFTGNRAGDTHYVCLEINPRIEFLTDKDYTVKSVRPLNQEAKELIINETLTNIPMTEACDKFLTLCAKSGYLKVDGNNNAVKLSVLSGFNQGLEVKLNKTINQFFVKNNIMGLVIESSQDLKQFKDSKQYKVSSEKYDLMLAVKENNPDERLENLTKLNNKQLIDKIEQQHNNYKLEFTEKELENKLALMESYSDIFDKHISNISHSSTRKFKENLKAYKSEKSKTYKLDFEHKYNEWLFG